MSKKHRATGGAFGKCRNHKWRESTLKEATRRVEHNILLQQLLVGAANPESLAELARLRSITPA